MINTDMYITRGIQEHFSVPVQQVLWNIVMQREREAKKQGIKPDYLSVFHIRDAENKDESYIKLLQEEPPYSYKYRIKTKETFKKRKVYVIREDRNDIGSSYFVMLLPEEY
ncbi:hypothetical protein CW674_05200 [Macrococcoides caseolyticum]|uniref:DUF960 family protein n=1 Tax=Macrococcoides caseolyticum TaxID=69966 RepID=UPI000C32FEC5|nr:DUF960 family protein [Macrococcus caseolyticus]PKE50744.1 hypothetical protein CW672_04460 [Macrococcus caseolyticus]PKE65703.1 hypothetical protein CW674_05200 [Macrococcus caseolyticus]